MALEINTWGPAGTLHSIYDFSGFNGMGILDLIANVDPSILAGRVGLVEEDGAPAVRIRHYAEDITTLGHRTEVAIDNYSGIYDWVGEAVPGATENASRKWYRWGVKIPPQDLSYLSGVGGPFFLVGQLLPVPDDSPADTGGGQPALALHVRIDAYGRYRWAISQNHPTDATYTGGDISHEVASWPFRFNEWQDIVVHVDPWSYSSAGNMTVWRNRRQVFKETNQPNGHNNSPARGGAGFWAKIGCYGAPNVYMEAIHRGFIIGDHASSFSEMHPDQPGAVALDRVVGPRLQVGSPL